MKAIVVVLCLLATVAGAQEIANVEPVVGSEVSFQDDPGQVLYKKGYAAVLAKKWDEARKHFAELSKNYPKSKYIDAAKYWTAYAVAQTDRKKAEDLYREFLDQYRESKYFEDAVADYEKLTMATSEAYVLAPVPPPPPKPGFPVPVAAPLAKTEVVVGVPKREVDPAVQLKMDAIRALAADPDDEEAFATVKAIALDPKQPTELREAALQTVGMFKTKNVASVYLQVAASGDPRLRRSAIYGIGNVANKGDEQTLQALRKLARDPKEARDIRAAALTSLSRLDATGMIDVLSDIAKNDPDRKLRVQAVYLIAQAGDDQRALSTLKGIASEETQDREVRESAVHALSAVKSEESLAYLKGVVSSSKDTKLRLSALYALSRYQDGHSEEITKMLSSIAGSTREDPELRLAAVYGLRPSAASGSREFLMSLALKDGDRKIRQAALHLLIQASEDKPAMLSTLIDVFEKSGGDDQELREIALYGIASVGNDQAISYLTTVAKSDSDYDMRRRAVYYLGSVGGEKAKSALLDILKQP